MKSWNPINNKKFETLSYLPPLSPQQILRQVDYLLAQGWSPCVEFDADGVIHREHHTSPGYYDGRYWTMWKLPMFGCQDANAVLREVEECKRTYPGVYVRVLGFNRKRQVQAASFIVYKPDGSSSSNNGSWQATSQSSQSSSRSNSWDQAPAPSRQSSSRSSSWEDAPSFFGGGAPAQREEPRREEPRQRSRSSSSRSWEDTPSFFG
jgi:ribulose-bisphosphate carboxylase small chain